MFPTRQRILLLHLAGTGMTWQTDSSPSARENQRVPCPNEMSRNLQTVYATARQRLH
jgi:hypothetical protein